MVDEFPYYTEFEKEGVLLKEKYEDIIRKEGWDLEKLNRIRDEEKTHDSETVHTFHKNSLIITDIHINYDSKRRCEEVTYYCTRLNKQKYQNEEQERRDIFNHITFNKLENYFCESTLAMREFIKIPNDYPLW